jgi:hypothetical protein
MNWIYSRKCPFVDGEKILQILSSGCREKPVFVRCERLFLKIPPISELSNTMRKIMKWRNI